MIKNISKDPLLVSGGSGTAESIDKKSAGFSEANINGLKKYSWSITTCSFQSPITIYSAFLLTAKSHTELFPNPTKISAFLKSIGELCQSNSFDAINPWDVKPGRNRDAYNTLGNVLSSRFTISHNFSSVM